MFAVYIATKNDTNGNPRRGWIIYGADGAAEAFVDEGYDGTEALWRYSREYQLGAHIPATDRINVPPSEYNRWAKAAFWEKL